MKRQHRKTTITAPAYTGAKDRCLSCMSLVQDGEETTTIETRNGDRMVHVRWEDCAKSLRRADKVFTMSLGPGYRHSPRDPYAKQARPELRY